MSLPFLLTSPNSAFSLTPKPSDHPEHIEILSNVKVKVKVAQLYPTLFSRPEYRSGQPFPSPGELPNPGIKPRSLTLQVTPAHVTGEKHGLKGYKHPNVQYSTVYNRQDMEAT